MTRTTDRKERDRLEIMDRYLKGESQSAIAADFGVSRQQIGKDIKVVRNRWKAEQMATIEEHIAQKLAEIGLVKQEAWTAWDASCGEKQTVTTSNLEKGDRTTKKLSVRREQMTGNPAYLHQVLDCIRQECALLNLPTELKYQDINAAIAKVVASGYKITDPGNLQEKGAIA